MASQILSVEKQTIPAGKEGAGQPYYIQHCLVGSMQNPHSAKRCIFMTGNAAIDKKIVEYWDEVIKTGNFPPIDLRYVSVGDSDVNPNSKPLPPYRTKKRDGSISREVYTAMRVLVQYEDGVMIDSPRNTAIRIINTLCEPVVMSESSPEMAEGTPNPLG